METKAMEHLEGVYLSQSHICALLTISFHPPCVSILPPLSSSSSLTLALWSSSFSSFVFPIPLNSPYSILLNPLSTSTCIFTATDTYHLSKRDILDLVRSIMTENLNVSSLFHAHKVKLNNRPRSKLWWLQKLSTPSKKLWTRYWMTFWRKQWRRQRSRADSSQTLETSSLLLFLPACSTNNCEVYWQQLSDALLCSILLIFQTIIACFNICTIFSNFSILIIRQFDKWSRRHNFACQPNSQI